MANVFISYRRSDTTSGYASWIYDRLADAFGADRIFMDVDSLPLGVDFVEHLERALASTDVALVLIGPAWLDALDEAGNRRLNDPDDLVRLEVAAALRSSSRVIPVLVDGAEMPGRAALPQDLWPLARRQALIFQRHGRAAIQEILTVIETVAHERETTLAAEREQAAREAEERAQRAAQKRVRNRSVAVPDASATRIETRSIDRKATPRKSSRPKRTDAAWDTDPPKPANGGVTADGFASAESSARKSSLTARSAAAQEEQRESSAPARSRQVAWATAERLAGLPARMASPTLRGVAISPADDRLATAWGDGTVTVHKLPTAGQSFKYAHTAEATGVRFSPGGELIASSGMDGSIRLWSIADRREAGVLRHDRGVCSLAFSPDGATLAAGTADGAVSMWDLATHELALTWKANPGGRISRGGSSSAAIGIAFTPDGRVVAVAHEAGLFVVHSTDGAEVFRVRHAGWGVYDVAVSSDGRFAAVTWSDDRVHVYSIPDAHEIASLEHPPSEKFVVTLRSAFGVSFSPCGGHMATARSDTVRVWDTREWTQVRVFPPDRYQVQAVAYSPDGALLAAGGNSVSVWGHRKHYER